MRISGVNGQPALVGFLDGALVAAIIPEIAGGLITAVYTVVIPNKLAFMADQYARAQTPGRLTEQQPRPAPAPHATPSAMEPAAARFRR